MRGSGAQKNAFKLFARARIIACRVIHFGQLYTTGAPAVQKYTLYVRRPTHRFASSLMPFTAATKRRSSSVKRAVLLANLPIALGRQSRASL